MKQAWLRIRRGESVRWGAFCDSFVSHVNKYKELPNLGERAEDFLGAVRLNSPEAALAGWKHLLASVKAGALGAEAIREAARVNMESIELAVQGKQFEALRFESVLDGRPVDLNALRGKVVLIDFWATWCKPCVAEMPNIKAVYKKYHDAGFEVIGVSGDSGPREAFLEFSRQGTYEWPQHYDGKGTNNYFAALFSVKSWPTSYLISRDGGVVERNLRGPNLEIAVRRHLGIRYLRATAQPDLVAPGATWKYKDDGSDQGVAWREPGFNDSAWAEGSAEFGYGDSGIKTVVNFGSDKNTKFITTYFRHVFETADPAKYRRFKGLHLGTVCDDGCVVYLNGKEVSRINLPNGEINFRTLASRPIDRADETEFWPDSVDPALLRKGRNVIAVEVHQQRSSSSDVRFNLQLAAEEATVTATSAAPAATLSRTFDGPYIMPGGNGWEAWTVTAAGAGLAKHIKPVALGDSITVQAVGSRPAFTVKLREPAAPGPDEASLPKNISAFLMADSHGEFEIASELLINQGVIDRDLKWSFGKGHLVVLGDIFDRGPRQTEILWLLYKLEEEAQAAGGALHMNVGNHEAMVLMGDIRYLNNRYTRAAEALGVGSYSELWSKDTLLGQWLRSKATVFKLGSTLCVHGGISARTVADKWTIHAINTTVRAWLDGDPSVDATKVQFIMGSSGPLWHRGHVGQGDSRDDIAKVKAFYKVDRIVVGHTKVDAVQALYGGDVIAVQVYPTLDASGMNMEGAYVDAKGVWHRAKIDGTREPLNVTSARTLSGISQRELKEAA